MVTILSSNIHRNEKTWLIKNTLADLARIEENYGEARSSFQSAIDQAEGASLADLEFTLQHALAITERDAGNQGQARRLLEEIVDSTEGSDPLSAMVYGELAAMAEKNGDLRKALNYLKLQSAINDSLKVRERDDQLESVQTLNKISLEEQEIQFQQQQDALTKDAKLKRAQLVSGLYLSGQYAGPQGDTVGERAAEPGPLHGVAQPEVGIHPCEYQRIGGRCDQAF